MAIFDRSGNKASVSAELQRPSMAELDRIGGAACSLRSRRENTTHYSVVDDAGDAVAVTTTLNDNFGSRGRLCRASASCLTMRWTISPPSRDSPNLYGLIQGEANAIAPGKRPLSAMTPTMLVKDGRLLLVLGSPGGPTIITTVANVVDQRGGFRRRHPTRGRMLRASIISGCPTS